MIIDSKKSKQLPELPNIADSFANGQLRQSSTTKPSVSAMFPLFPIIVIKV
jgi:hypothetical protein|nr:MAG TPA: hypothetical protein [Caudoviricetes sp.]